MAGNDKSRVGRFAGIPYDWRRPTMARFKSRIWNPDAPFVNDRWFGWGYDFNLFALFHPVKWRAARNRAKK